MKIIKILIVRVFYIPGLQANHPHVSGQSKWLGFRAMV